MKSAFRSRSKSKPDLLSFNALKNVSKKLKAPTVVQKLESPIKKRKPVKTKSTKRIKLTTAAPIKQTESSEEDNPQFPHTSQELAQQTAIDKYAVESNDVISGVNVASESSVFETVERLSLKLKPQIEKNFDPSTKAMNFLIQALAEQKNQHERNKEKNESKIKIHSVYPKFQRLQTIPKKPNKKPIVPRKLDEKLSKPRAEKAKMEEARGQVDTNPDGSVSIKLEEKNFQPLTKKAKIEIPDEIPDGFGYLRLEALESYEVPPEIVKIESNEDSSYMAVIIDMVKNSNNKSYRYFEAFTALLLLEEAAEGLYLKRYNQESIQLSYSNSGNLFEIKET